MGTTLALSGAYNLAGALLQHHNPSSAPEIDAAFAQYEEKMRPVVARAQKLVPGAPYTFNPDTAWGIWTFLTFLWLLTLPKRLGLFTLLASWLGPPAHMVSVEEYGFRQAQNLDLDGDGPGFEGESGKV